MWYYEIIGKAGVLETSPSIYRIAFDAQMAAYKKLNESPLITTPVTVRAKHALFPKLNIGVNVMS